MDFDQPPVVRVTADRGALDPDEWPMNVPAVAQVVRGGLDLPKGVTFLVGENGSGKSTLVEGIAVAYGLSPEGGSGQSRHSTRPSHRCTRRSSFAADSPVLAAMPGATILEVGDWGLRSSTWEELELLQHWRRYLDDPRRYLRHILD